MAKKVVCYLYCYCGRIQWCFLHWNNVSNPLKHIERMLNATLEPYRTPSFKIHLIFYLVQEQKVFLKQSCILPFSCYKSATACQIDSNKVSNSKSVPMLFNCIDNGTIAITTPPQQSHKRSTMYWDILYNRYQQTYHHCVTFSMKMLALT